MEQGNNKSFLSDEVVKEEELSFLSDEVVTEGEVKKKVSSEATSGVPTLLKPPIKESTSQSEQGGLDFSQTPSEILAKETSKKELDLSNIFYKAQKGQLQADLVDFAIPDQEPNKNTPDIDDLTLRTKVVRGLREQSKEKAQALKNGLEKSVVEGERLIEQYRNNPTPELKAEIEQRQQDFLLTQKAYNKEAFIQDAYEKRLVQSSDSIKRLANDKISDNFYAGVYQGLKGNTESWGEAKDLFLKSKAEQIEYAKKQNEIAPTKEGGLINQAGQMIGGVLPDIAVAIGFSLAGLPSVGATTVAVRQGAQQAAEDFSRAFNKAKITKMDFGGEMRLPTDDEAYDIATKSAGVGFGTGAIEGLFGTITGNVGGRIANRARTKVGKIVAEKALDTGIDATVAGTMQTGRNVFDRAQGLDTKLTEGVAENMLGEISLSAPINTVSGAKAVSKEKKNQRAKSIFESVVKSKDNPEELQKLKENIEVLTNQGLITKEDAVEITQKANDYARVVPTIPEEVKNKQDAADLIIERDELEVKKESVDKAFQKPIEERINAINDELVNVDNKENEIRSTDNNIQPQVESPQQEIKPTPIEVIAGKEQGDGGVAKVVQGDGQGELAPKTTEEIVADVELKKQEAESKIKRRDLFDGVGEFSTELGGSDKAAVPISHKEKNGIEFVEYAHPETGSVDVIVTGKSDNDFVGFYRIYENGKPTNKWSSKFENQSRNKEDFKTMIGGVQEMLPQGHEYTEKSSISTDGLRVWEQQLSRGYELQYDKNGKLITNLVAINGDAIVNELGIPVQKGEFENIKVKSQEEFEIVKKALLPYLEKLGLNENDIRWLTGTVKINLPVLKSTKETPQEKAVGENVEVVTPKENEALRDVESTLTALGNLDIDWFDDFQNKFGEGIKSAKDVSEAYHKAKADGTNPELVKAVESLLSKEQTPSGIKEQEIKVNTPDKVQEEVVETAETLKAQPTATPETKAAIDVYNRLKENNDTTTRKEYKALPESIKRVLDNIVNINKQLEQNKLITKKGNCPWCNQLN